MKPDAWNGKDAGGNNIEIKHIFPWEMTALCNPSRLPSHRHLSPAEKILRRRRNLTSGKRRQQGMCHHRQWNISLQTCIVLCPPPPPDFSGRKRGGVKHPSGSSTRTEERSTLKLENRKEKILSNPVYLERLGQCFPAGWFQSALNWHSDMMTGLWR